MVILGSRGSGHGSNTRGLFHGLSGKLSMKYKWEKSRIGQEKTTKHNAYQIHRKEKRKQNILERASDHNRANSTGKCKVKNVQ